MNEIFANGFWLAGWQNTAILLAAENAVLFVLFSILAWVDLKNNLFTAKNIDCFVNLLLLRTWDAREETLTIAPLDFFKCGIAAFEIKIGALTLTPKIKSIISPVTSSRFAKQPIPALLTKTSSPPNFSIVSLTNRGKSKIHFLVQKMKSEPAWLESSSSMAKTPAAPAFSHSSLIPSSFSLFRPWRTTLNPFFANKIAEAAPMPRELPVIIAVLKIFLSKKYNKKCLLLPFFFLINSSSFLCPYLARL